MPFAPQLISPCASLSPILTRQLVWMMIWNELERDFDMNHFLAPVLSDLRTSKIVDLGGVSKSGGAERVLV
jgi:hypothetical protein